MWWNCVSAFISSWLADKQYHDSAGAVPPCVCMYVIPQQPRFRLLQRKAACPILTPARPPGTQPRLKRSPLNLTGKRSRLSPGARGVESPLRWRGRKGQVLGEQGSCSLRCPAVGSISSHATHPSTSYHAAGPRIHPHLSACLRWLSLTVPCSVHPAHSPHWVRRWLH